MIGEKDIETRIHLVSENEENHWELNKIYFTVYGINTHDTDKTTTIS